MATQRRLTASGTGNIDSVFGLDENYYLIGIAVHFSLLDGGGTTGTANLTLNKDSAHRAMWDTELWYDDAGYGADIHFRVPLEEREHWCFNKDDRLKLAWTDPSSGNIVWGIEMILEPINATNR